LPCIFRSIKRDDKGKLVKELLSPTTHEKLANQIKELVEKRKRKLTVRNFLIYPIKK
jgi:hypothetical protein